MNYLVLSNIGGLPVTQDRIDFLQQAHLKAFEALAKLCGDKTILYGVEVLSGTVSDGWISYNGELLPFIGGSAAAQVVIVETQAAFTFQDNNSHNVQITRYATCGSIGGAFNFTDLKRIETLSNLEKWLPGDVKMVSCDDAYIAANFDGTGLGISERTGWAIMNGGNGTTDWRGKFIVGYDDADSDYNSMADAGGNKNHVVTNDNIAATLLSLRDFVTDAANGTGLPSIKGDTSNNDIAGSVKLKLGVDTPTPIDHRPPFKVTLYIQKL